MLTLGLFFFLIIWLFPWRTQFIIKGILFFVTYFSLIFMLIICSLIELLFISTTKFINDLTRWAEVVSFKSTWNSFDCLTFQWCGTTGKVLHFPQLINITFFVENEVFPDWGSIWVKAEFFQCFYFFPY